MRLPAYPLITIDPFTSIWSKFDLLDGGDTSHWTGKPMPLFCRLTVDGESYSIINDYMSDNSIAQQPVEVTPMATKYVFENDKFSFTLVFRSVGRIDKTETLGLPFGYVDWHFAHKKNKEHNVEVLFAVPEQVVYDKRRSVRAWIEERCGIQIGKMGLKRQKPLSAEGDSVNLKWGYVCLSAAGGVAKAEKYDGKHFLSDCVSFSTADEQSGFFVVAYDDIESIDYFDDHLKGYWTKRFDSIEQVILYAIDQHDVLVSDAREFEQKLLSDAAFVSEEYQQVLTAAYRQTLAAHKLVEDENGNLLYLSKECHSNGCINTVDVSYPSIPIMCLYNPDLLAGLMTAIFRFARMKCWDFDFAPHDVGTYPRVSGQVYGLKPHVWARNRRACKKVYTYDKNVFFYKFQMPIEECGNMLIMAYAYYALTADKSYIDANIDLLKKWCDYLVSKGVILENQLCTDDFAGHLEKNVNLAIKAVFGIEAYSRIIAATDSAESEKYHRVAVDYAAEIQQKGKDGCKLLLAFDTKNTWSLKYNMVWDIVWNSGLFDKQTIADEVAFYRDNQNKFGISLDSRGTFTKSDWIMWAATLDDSDELVRLSASKMLLFLSNSSTRVPFSDYYDVATSEQIGFQHRSVQGGLWMPILAKKWNELKKI